MNPIKRFVIAVDEIVWTLRTVRTVAPARRKGFLRGQGEYVWTVLRGTASDLALLDLL